MSEFAMMATIRPRLVGAPSDAPMGVRPLLPSDIGPLVRRLGPLVNDLYPRGAEKLLARLEAARDGYAVAAVLEAPGTSEPIGLAAEAPKGSSRRKLSTFWIDPRYRGQGGGSLLLDSRVRDWTRRDVEAVHVTVREERSAPLERLFLPRGFVHQAYEANRYGEGRSEITLCWSLAGSRELRCAA